MSDTYDDIPDDLLWLEPSHDELTAMNATLDADAGLDEEFD